MEKIFTLICCLPLFCFAQNYTEIVNVEGKTAEQLYTTAREWYAIAFNSASDVLQLEDPENKKLIGKGTKNIEYTINNFPAYMTVFFSLVTEFKDGRYRYEIYSTSIKSIRGDEYTYDLLESLTTEEGLIKYYTAQNIKSGSIGKKQIAKNIESNKTLLANINRLLKSIPADLHNTIIKSGNNNW
jgi:hypothetical protein